MKFRVGACALLVGLAGCSAEGTHTKFGDLMGSASPSASSAKHAPKVPAVRSPANSIASAPDRGALVSYKNKGVASKQEGAYTWYPVTVSEEHALKAVATGQMTIPSPDGSQVKLRYERHIEHADGNWTWIGRVEGGDQMQEAILTFGEQAVYGSVPQAAGAPALSLQTRAGVLWAVVTDLSKVVSPNKGTNDVMLPPALALRASLASVAAKAQVTQRAVAAGAPATAANTIDVAIGYTQGFATAQGGPSAAVTRLNFLIEVGNQAFTNSLINGYLRIVNTVQVDYADNTANEAALGQLTGHNGTSSVAVPAALVPIRTARDQYGADLAVLVRKFQTPENDGCGIAWLNGANLTPISPTADDDFGFAVISDGNDTGTDGKSYFCSPETLVHELGHLMGSAHDRENSKVNPALPATGTNLQNGRYPYSFGMKTDAANGNFYTIMAYGDDNQNFYRTFSNPLVARCGPAGNLACGVTDQTDNARSLNQTIPVVATFRATVVPISGVVLNFNFIAKMGGAGRTEVHTLTAASTFQTFSAHYATALAQGGTDKSVNYLFGDYNSDGVADLYLIVKMGSGGKTEVHVLNGVGGFNTFLLHAATPLNQTGSDNRWVFRLGDQNGDGRPDLYGIERMGGSSRTEVHILNGATSFQSFLAQSATVVGATGNGYNWAFDLGDFNADGKPDLYVIKKVGSGGRTEAHIVNGANGFQTYLANVATVLNQTGTDNRWDFKVGDYDRDGVLDIYSIDKSGASGRTEVHVLNGQGNFQSFSAHIATSILAVGVSPQSEFELSAVR